LTLQRDEIRRELLNLAVRETLRKHGIPQSWIQADMSSALTTRKLRGVHLRLLVREWQPELLTYTVGVQRAIQSRLLRLDPLSINWLAGISWQYHPVDDSTCPALPPAQYWAARRRPFYPRALANASLGDPGPVSTPPCRQEQDFRITEPMPLR
jgi:hypothetical protein